MVIPPRFDLAGPFADGLAHVRLGDETTGKHGFIDRSGQFVIRASFDNATGFAEGLCAIRMGDAAPFFLGWITELVQETDARIIVTVSLFPGKPEPIAVRAGDARNRANAQWTQALRLPPLEKLQIPASIVLPSGMGHRGRGVDVWSGGAKEVTVEEILEHGTDFDRVTAF
jgi:hypothetical protein